MKTRRPVRTPGGVVAVIAAVVLVAGCSSPSSKGGNGNFTTPVAVSSPTAGSSPGASGGASPSASPSTTISAAPADRPPATSGSFGVLAGPFVGVNYDVTLVGIDGKVAASAQASRPPSPTCAGQAAGVVPYPVSTSNAAAYYMDASGAVRWIAPGGSKSSGAVITLPVGPSTRSVFAVSPDDSKMAVAVIDFTAGGATTRLFVDDLATGGAHNQIFSESGSFILWPTGWHGPFLVVAKVPACTQGGGPTCCGPQEYHVVDPATAVRQYTVGGPTCVVVGLPTPAGTMCENTAFTKATELDWTGTSHQSVAISGPVAAYVSPTGNKVALVDNVNGTSLAGTNFTWRHLYACGWIDEIHVLSGGSAQAQPLVGEFPDGVTFPVAAQGDCAGRIPGGL